MVALVVGITIYKARGIRRAVRVARMGEKINASRVLSEGLKE